MSELGDAIARLEEAVARLEAASGEAKRAHVDEPADDRRAEDERVREIAGRIAGRIDAALARLGQLLEREE
jgi:hypothetical protein